LKRSSIFTRNVTRQCQCHASSGTNEHAGKQPIFQSCCFVAPPQKAAQWQTTVEALLRARVMAPTTRAASNRAISHVFALPELWAIVAEHSGVVGAWRLTGVCVAAREGAKVWLRTLPGLVVCGGFAGGGLTGVGGVFTSEVWRLDLGGLRWERMPSLTCGRAQHSCCAVRGRVAVLGVVFAAEDDESDSEEETETTIASVEILGFE
jgi:hypothetical protein